MDRIIEDEFIRSLAKWILGSFVIGIVAVIFCLNIGVLMKLYGALDGWFKVVVVNLFQAIILPFREITGQVSVALAATLPVLMSKLCFERETQEGVLRLGSRLNFFGKLMILTLVLGALVSFSGSVLLRLYEDIAKEISGQNVDLSNVQSVLTALTSFFFIYIAQITSIEVK